MHHLRDAPIPRTPSLELSLQTAYELTFKISDGTHAVILGLASEINQADSVVEIDWTQHPDGMVFFRSGGPKGDRVLHGCFPSNDLEGMSMNMNRSLRYYENLEKFLGTSQSAANAY